MDVLAQIAVQLVGDSSPLNNSMDNAIAYSQRAGSRAGSAFAIGFSNPILNALSGVNSLVGSMRTLVSITADLSGMRVAADFGDFRRQLTGIAGDAVKAGSAFEKLVALANSTNFDVPDVTRFAIRQAGKTGDVDGAITKTENILNAAAAFGVKQQDFDRFQTNIGQIENKGANTAGVVDTRQFLNASPIATTAIAKAMGVSVDEVSRKLVNATGNDLTRMISLTGQKNKGLAQTQASGDPFKIAANTLDSAKTGIEPTGRLLNSVLTPLAMGMKTLTDNFGELNKATGGAAGLVGIIAGGIITVRTFGGVTKGAMDNTIRLTESLIAMSGAAGGAALAVRGAAMITAGGAAGTTLTGGAGVTAAALRAGAGVGAHRAARLAQGAANAEKAALAAAEAAARIAPNTAAPVAGMARAWQAIGRFGPALSSLARVGRIGAGIAAALIPIGAQMGAAYLGQQARASGHPGRANTFEGVSSGIGTGSAWGTAVGAVIGGIIGIAGGPAGILAGAGIGATAGGLVGGAIGGVGGGIQGARKPLTDKKADAGQSELTSATRDLTKTMRDMNSKVFGGGSRARSVTGSLDAEYALVRSAQTGWA